MLLTFGILQKLVVSTPTCDRAHMTGDATGQCVTHPATRERTRWAWPPLSPGVTVRGSKAWEEHTSNRLLPCTFGRTCGNVGGGILNIKANGTEEGPGGRPCREAEKDKIWNIKAQHVCWLHGCCQVSAGCFGVSQRFYYPWRISQQPGKKMDTPWRRSCSHDRSR